MTCKKKKTCYVINPTPDKKIMSIIKKEKRGMKKEKREMKNEKRGKKITNNNFSLFSFLFLLSSYLKRPIRQILILLPHPFRMGFRKPLLPDDFFAQIHSSLRGVLPRGLYCFFQYSIKSGKVCRYVPVKTGGGIRLRSRLTTENEIFISH